MNYKRSKIIALFALVCGLLMTAPGRAATADYVHTLRSAVHVLDVAARANRIPNIRLSPAPLPGPPRFSPSLDDWLQAGLIAARSAKKPKQRAAALRLLASTLERIADAAGTEAPATPERDPTTTARAILANPNYVLTEARTPAERPKSLWQRFIEWLARQLDRIFGGIFNTAASKPLIGDIIAVSMLALAALGLGYVFYRLGQTLATGRRRRASADLGEELEAPANPDDIFAAASAQAASGQYARAIVLLFQATLIALDRAGAVAFDPARTAGEYRRAVRRARAVAAEPFDRLARVFTLAAYAETPVSQNEWSESNGWYEALKPLVESP